VTLNLNFPVSDSFKASDLQLHLKANFQNLSISKINFLELKNGTIELFNKDNKIQLNINDKQSLSINLLHHHEEENKHLNKISVMGDVAIEKEFTLNNITFNKGIVKVTTNIINDDWSTTLDLANAEIFLIPLGYTKPLSNSLNISCSGKILDKSFESNDCIIGGNKFKGKISFIYSYEDHILSKLILNRAIINDNEFSLEAFSKKEFSIKKFLILPFQFLFDLINEDLACAIFGGYSLVVIAKKYGGSR
jgi:hypothetical protein